jgi:hypothetical protein
MSGPINLNEFLQDLNVPFDLDADSAQEAEAALIGSQDNAQDNTQVAGLEQNTNTVTETNAGDGGIAVGGAGGSIGQSGGDGDDIVLNFGDTGDGGDADASGGDAVSVVEVDADAEIEQDAENESDQDLDQSSVQDLDNEQELDAEAEVEQELEDFGVA